MWDNPIWMSGLAALGLGVGVISGMFGVGGGFLMTPLLAMLFVPTVDIAVGTGLCQMIGASTAALIRYSRLRIGENKISWMMLAGSLVGVDLGARLVGVLSHSGEIEIAGRAIAASRWWLSLAYILLLGLVAFQMARDAHRPSRPPGVYIPPGPLARLRVPPLTELPRSGHVVSIPVIAFLGLFLGFLSGLLGIGGGVVLIPVLVYGVGMRVKEAAATGIGVLLATSLVGTMQHARMGHVDLGIAATLLIGSTLGAQAGAVIAARTDGQRLRGLFAVLVAATTIAVATNLVGKVLGRP